MLVSWEVNHSVNLEMLQKSLKKSCGRIMRCEDCVFLECNRIIFNVT